MTLVCAVFVLFSLLDSPVEAGFQQDVIGIENVDIKKENDKTNHLGQSNWKDLIHSPFLRLVSAGYLVVFTCKTSVTEWGQLYLIEDLGLPIFVGKNNSFSFKNNKCNINVISGSIFVSALEIGGFFGGIAAGYITDWLMERVYTKGVNPFQSNLIPYIILFRFIQFSSRNPKINPRMFAAFWIMIGVSGHFFLLTSFISSSSTHVSFPRCRSDVSDNISKEFFFFYRSLSL